MDLPFDKIPCEKRYLFYNIGMAYNPQLPWSEHEHEAILQRRRESAKLHEIEGNPFTAEVQELFAMFDAEGLDHDQRLEFIHDHIKARTQSK